MDEKQIRSRLRAIVGLLRVNLTGEPDEKDWAFASLRVDVGGRFSIREAAGLCAINMRDINGTWLPLEWSQSETIEGALTRAETILIAHLRDRVTEHPERRDKFMAALRAVEDVRKETT